MNAYHSIAVTTHLPPSWKPRFINTPLELLNDPQFVDGEHFTIHLKELVEQQNTQPLPVVKLVSACGGGLLTLRQVRERCGINQVQLARAAGVRPVVVDWCERGRAVRPDEARRILEALARCMSDVHTPTAFVGWEGEQR